MFLIDIQSECGYAQIDDRVFLVLKSQTLSVYMVNVTKLSELTEI